MQKKPTCNALTDFKKSHNLVNADDFQVFRELISEIEILKSELA